MQVRPWLLSGTLVAAALGSVATRPAQATPCGTIQVPNRQFLVTSFSAVPGTGTGPAYATAAEAGWHEVFVQSADTAFASPGVVEAHTGGPLTVTAVTP